MLIKNLPVGWLVDVNRVLPRKKRKRELTKKTIVNPKRSD